jgi:uncharacterized protein
VVGVLVGLAAVVLLALAVAGTLRFMLFPWLPRDLGGAPNLDGRARHVRIPVEDDYLDGWYLPGRLPAAVLILHGFGRDHHRAWRYGAFLENAGYGVLAIDFRSSRGLGRGRRVPTTLGHHELPDGEAALRWLRQQEGLDGGAIGVLGESLGGSVALIASARHDFVRAIVVDGAFAHSKAAIEDSTVRWARLPREPAASMARAFGRAATGLDPGGTDAAAAARLLRDRPIFFIHGLKDNRLTPSHVEQLWEAAGAKDEQWILAETGHNEAWIDHREEYERRVLAFFAKHLSCESSGASAI